MARWENALRTNDEITRLKREAVIRESARIFSRRGYHNASLDDVAKSLNVSKGTLYNYVTDKEEILFESLKMALDLGERAFALAREEAGSGADKLRATLRNYISMLHDELGACGMITEVDSLKPNHRREIVARRDVQQGWFVDILKEGIADGTIRPVDEKLAVYTFMGAVNGIARWYSPKGRLSHIEIAEGVVDILMGGLASPADRAGSAAKVANRQATPVAKVKGKRASARVPRPK